ncbi:hypothetical protein M422DRAFT_109750, partial [Sphaerobolus stellatus SS14]
IHAVYYPPTNPEYEGLPSELPPCIDFIHGGSSARQAAGFDWIYQYYTSRGWAWLDVNYGGSTGFGTKYMQGRIIVRGNSAGNRLLKITMLHYSILTFISGGFSVLRSLCALPTFYQRGISSYGISDLKRFTETTHKFQLHYMFKLQGGTPEEIPEVYRERSPLYHADKIEVPLIMFQGDADMAVPAVQTEAIVKIIRDRGGRVDYILFPGEGHG